MSDLSMPGRPPGRKPTQGPRQPAPDDPETRLRARRVAIGLLLAGAAVGAIVGLLPMAFADAEELRRELTTFLIGVAAIVLARLVVLEMKDDLAAEHVATAPHTTHRAAGDAEATDEAEDKPPLRLAGVDLREAVLPGVDLRKTELTDADLRRTDLRNADLRGADLRGADLRGAILDKALLEGAIYDENTTWPALESQPNTLGAVHADERA